MGTPSPTPCKPVSTLPAAKPPTVSGLLSGTYSKGLDPKLYYQPHIHAAGITKKLNPCKTQFCGKRVKG